MFTFSASSYHRTLSKFLLLHSCQMLQTVVLIIILINDITSLDNLHCCKFAISLRRKTFPPCVCFNLGLKDTHMKAVQGQPKNRWSLFSFSFSQTFPHSTHIKSTCIPKFSTVPSFEPIMNISKQVATHFRNSFRIPKPYHATQLLVLEF